MSNSEHRQHDIENGLDPDAWPFEEVENQTNQNHHNSNDSNQANSSAEESFESDSMRPETSPQDENSDQESEENCYCNRDLTDEVQLTQYLQKKTPEEIINLKTRLESEKKLSCSNLLQCVKPLFQGIHRAAGFERVQFRYLKEYQDQDYQDNQILRKKRKRIQGSLKNFRQMMSNYPLEMGPRPSPEMMKRFMFRKNKLVYRILYNMSMGELQKLMYNSQNLKIQPTKCQKNKRLLRRVVYEVLKKRIA